MTRPPPAPHRSPNRDARAWKIILAIVCSGVVLVAVGIFAINHYLGASGITRPLDNMFGDQHLKTTVALVELYRVRYGRYPKSLRDIRFAGDWDQGAPSSPFITTQHLMAASNALRSCEAGWANLRPYIRQNLARHWIFA